MLDYVEENLSPELIAELMLFLENNPDLKEELDEFEMHELQPEETFLPSKADLKKSDTLITLDNYEEIIIAEIEGENTAEVSQLLHLFLEKNPDKQSDFIGYQKTKLIASSIFFEDKESLKKREGKVIPLYWWYASAAAVVVILFLFNVFNEKGKSNEHPIATNKNEVILPNHKPEELITPNEKLVENNEVTDFEDKKNSPVEHEQKRIKEKRNHYVQQKIEEKQDVLAVSSNNEQELKKDTVLQVIEEEPIETIQYADNVKITYEDELAVNTTNQQNDEYKTVGQLISQPFKKRFVAIFGSKNSNE